MKVLRGMMTLAVDCTFLSFFPEFSFALKLLILLVGRFGWRAQNTKFKCVSILVKKWW